MLEKPEYCNTAVKSLCSLQIFNIKLNILGGRILTFLKVSQLDSPNSALPARPYQPVEFRSWTNLVTHRQRTGGTQPANKYNSFLHKCQPSHNVVEFVLLITNNDRNNRNSSYDNKSQLSSNISILRTSFVFWDEREWEYWLRSTDQVMSRCL